MQIKKLAIIYALLTVAAQSAMAAQLGEMTSLQEELDIAKVRAEIDKTKKIGAPETVKPMSAGGSSQRDPVLIMKGIYGVGNTLNAIVSIDGAEVTFAEGETIIGYRAKNIAPHEATLVKVDAKGKEIKNKLYKLHLTAGNSSLPVNALALPPVPAANAPMPPSNTFAQ